MLDATGAGMRQSKQYPNLCIKSEFKEFYTIDSIFECLNEPL